MRQCKKCKQEKEEKSFYKSSPGVCISCKRNQNKQWKQDNQQRQKENLRRNSLRRNYGITLEQYEELLKKQDYSCAVCKRHKDEFTKNLAVDHDHHNGQIRGLLCNYCNHRLVGRHRDSNLLRKIADYLDQGTGWFVPKKPRKKKKRNG